MHLDNSEGLTSDPLAGASTNIPPSYFGGGGTDNGGLGINWEKLEGRLFLFDLGVKHGFGAGVDSTIGFVKSLGTAKGWENLGQGIVDLGHFANQFSPEGMVMRAQMGESVTNYMTNVPNMSAYEVGYDIGFASEKVGESIVLTRGAGLGVNSVRSASANLILRNKSIFNNNNWFRLGKGWNPNIKANNMRAAWGAHPNHINSVPPRLRGLNNRLRNFRGGHKHFPNWWREY